MTAATALLAEAQQMSVDLGVHGDWLAARIASTSGDAPGERAALQRILTRDRRDLAALLAMGQSHANSGDRRSAAVWFRTALNQAQGGNVPQQLHPLLEQAQRFIADTQSQLADEFAAQIDQLGVSGAGSPALRHAINLLYGRSELYFQQPTMFYYPGLPQRCFYERAEFDWVALIEDQSDILRDEFLALLNGGDEAFSPYIQRPDNRPASSSPLLEDPAWGAAYLLQNGEQTALADHCPATLDALGLAPIPTIPNRSPMALYSRLKPGTHIAPHHGLLNTRLICHLPLIIPDDCALRVGHETRAWRYGEMLIFDDSMEHEAWNRGSTDRTILLFEIWRPEIPAEDRDILGQLFAAIDATDPDRGKEQ